MAAGSGTRFGSDLPKQYQLLHGKPVVAHSVERLRACFPEAPLVLVCDPAHTYYQTPSDVQVVAGGTTRQASVYAGLRALEGQRVTHVLIHDAARPFVDASACFRLIAALREHEAAVPVVPLSDTLKRVAAGMVAETLDRAEIMAVQTPQAFHYEMILALHRAAAGENNRAFTDDAGICEAAGVTVATVEGAASMKKITYGEDLAGYAATAPAMRVGMGYDVHRLLPFAQAVDAANRTIRLGGIDVPHTHYLEGHSDADVVLHALTDAVLGAIGEGDIGLHFPPSDMSFRKMDSARFVKHACRLMTAKGGALFNADITLIGERPKISPYREAMKERIAAIMGVDASVINVKATTTERLGFEGRGEGLAAQAIVSVVF